MPIFTLGLNLSCDEASSDDDASDDPGPANADNDFEVSRHSCIWYFSGVILCYCSCLD